LLRRRRRQGGGRCGQRGNRDNHGGRWLRTSGRHQGEGERR
jgi:hypothetical protein